MAALRLMKHRTFSAARPLATTGATTRGLLLSFTHKYSAQGYGDHEQNNVTNSEATHSREHPGPPSPAEQEKKKKTSKNPEDASAQSGGSRSKDAIEKGSSPTGGRMEQQ